MRKLIWLCLAATVLYSGYWFIGARASERGMAMWLDARQNEGWQAEYTNVATTGYPLTFHTALSDLALADPATGAAFSTSTFTVRTKSYAPTALTAQFAQSARVSTPFQHIDMNNKDMVATLDVDAGPSLSLAQSTFKITDLSVTSTLKWGFSLAEANATTLRHSGNPLTHDIDLHAMDLIPSANIMRLMNPEGLLADKFEDFAVDATVSFNKPWDISTLEGPRPQPRALQIDNISARWGKLDLRVAGRLNVDKRGIPTGALQVKAQNWKEMIALATAAGVIPERMETMMLRAGKLLAGIKGNSETLDAELTISGGMITLGFIPLGPAPRLIIR